MPDIAAPSETTPASAPNSITLCEIVAAFIRLMAINFGFYAVASSFTLFLRPGPLLFDRALLAPLFAVAIYLLIVYWLWTLAGTIARHVTRNSDSSISTSQLSLLDLYSFVFLFVGLYIAVENIGPTLSWLYYAFTRGASEASLTPDQKSNFYTLFHHFVKLVAGLGLVFNGRKLGARILRRYHPSAHSTSISHVF